MTDGVRDAPARAPRPAHAANVGLAFLLELGALAALGFWGVHTGQSLLADIALGAGAPLLAAGVWAMLAAPKSERRLHRTALWRRSCPSSAAPPSLSPSPVMRCSARCSPRSLSSTPL